MTAYSTFDRCRCRTPIGTQCLGMATGPDLLCGPCRERQPKGSDGEHWCDRSRTAPPASGGDMGVLCGGRVGAMSESLEPPPCDSDGCDLPAYAVGVLLVDETEPTCAYCAECVRILGGDFQITEMLAWGEVSVLPRGKYVVIERDDGWHVYTATTGRSRDGR